MRLTLGSRLRLKRVVWAGESCCGPSRVCGLQVLAAWQPWAAPSARRERANGQVFSSVLTGLGSHGFVRPLCPSLCQIASALPVPLAAGSLRVELCAPGACHISGLPWEFVTSYSVHHVPGARESKLNVCQGVGRSTERWASYTRRGRRASWAGSRRGTCGVLGKPHSWQPPLGPRGSAGRLSLLQSPSRSHPGCVCVWKRGRCQGSPTQGVVMVRGDLQYGSLAFGEGTACKHPICDSFLAPCLPLCDFGQKFGNLSAP